ncbi:MAG: phosphopantothenoylcysteine decarboxylase [Verrucomicrobia bacterium]|nr:phosphopantothenoylcysteine decarboxylase [Verrucomicrobiota bacterium]
MEKKATILVGVTGSIAAYKAADLVSKLVKAGHTIHVVMTREATELVTPLTFATLSRNPVTLNLFEELAEWKPQHVSLADDANLLVIAPATANVIAKLALGLADDALSSIALACQAPMLIAPAMNGKMWQHPATQQNVATLKKRGAQFIGPEAGLLACGYEGLGRLWNVDGIVAEIARLLKQKMKRKT